MRRTTSPGEMVVSGATILIVILLLLALQQGRAEPPPVSGKRADIRKLQEERIAALKEAKTIVLEYYNRGTSSLEDVNRCDRMLVEAELDAATSAKERVDILREAVASAKRGEEFATQRHAAGLCTKVEPLEAKAYRLRRQIELAKETAK